MPTNRHNLPIGTKVETSLEFEPGYEPGNIYIVGRIEHPTRFFCNMQEGIGVEFAHVEYVGNNDPNDDDDQFNFTSHQVNYWKKEL
jgi:hypothetical protein